jgi:hypothetical protein
MESVFYGVGTISWGQERVLVEVLIGRGAELRTISDMRWVSGLFLWQQNIGSYTVYAPGAAVLTG